MRASTNGIGESGKPPPKSLRRGDTPLNYRVEQLRKDLSDPTRVGGPSGVQQVPRSTSPRIPDDPDHPVVEYVVGPGE